MSCKALIMAFTLSLMLTIVAVPSSGMTFIPLTLDDLKMDMFGMYVRMLSPCNAKLFVSMESTSSSVIEIVAFPFETIASIGSLPEAPYI